MYVSIELAKCEESALKLYLTNPRISVYSPITTALLEAKAEALEALRNTCPVPLFDYEIAELFTAPIEALRSEVINRKLRGL